MNNSISSPIIEELNQGNQFLWSSNIPARFWQVEEELDPFLWKEAIINAIKDSGFPENLNDITTLLDYTLGEVGLERTTEIFPFSIEPIGK